MYLRKVSAKKGRADEEVFRSVGERYWKVMKGRKRTISFLHQKTVHTRLRPVLHLPNSPSRLDLKRNGPLLPPFAPLPPAGRGTVELDLKRNVYFALQTEEGRTEVFFDRVQADDGEAFGGG